MPLIIFSHANSFGAGTYKVLFKHLKARGFTVKAVDKFGHDTAYPVSNNWPHLVQQLADFGEVETAKHKSPAFFVGHSLGGFLSLMAAARHPHLARGVVLMDSPVLGGWRANTLNVIKRSQLVGSVSPGAVSQRRRHQWADKEAALTYFQSKKAFTAWHPDVLADYVETGTHDAHGKRVLSFDRDIETAIYNTLPDNLDRLLKRHPLKCKASFIGGTRSEEMKRVGMTLTERLIQDHPASSLPGRIIMLDGSHLFPMEKPLATAAAIEASILNLI
jgi:pimeloyl-ACP methyl ester carboxylesterase